MEKRNENLEGNGGIEISGRNDSAYFSGGYTPPIYTLREIGGTRGAKARATKTRKALAAAENKLGGFKNFTASARSSIALVAAFFPISL